MFGKAPKEEPLDAVIARILDEMDMYGPESEEYATLLAHLERVYNLRQNNKTKNVSPDTIALVAGNLLGILIIVAYEQKNVLTSKGLGFVMKGK